MKSWDIVGYVYKADIYDPIHAAQIVARDLGLPHPEDIQDTPGDWQSLARLAGVTDPEDERSFDSDDFPKVIFADSVEDDSEVCAVCGEPLIP